MELEICLDYNSLVENLSGKHLPILDRVELSDQTMACAACRSLAERNFSSSSASNHSNTSEAEWITNGLSLLIALIAFLGNSAALFIMFMSRLRARSAHDKYLLNLAVADLLRACFIPFTAIVRLKRNFIFGKLICRLLPVIQGN